MNLRELVDTVDVPETRVAEQAWERARVRLVRRRVWTAGAVGVAVATVLIGVTAIPRGQRAEHPTPAPTPSPAPGGVVVTVPDWDALNVDRVAPPTLEALPLSEDPVEHAALAMADPKEDDVVYVLGNDGDWRRVDAAGVQPLTDGSFGALVRPTSLNADGTQLALPQADGLVVVDLTTGSSKRYDVPGPANRYVVWTDDTHVLVAGELATTGTLVDLASGATEPSEYGPSTRVLPDGSALTWGSNAEAAPTWMSWSDGRQVRAMVGNGAGWFPAPPLVLGNVAVGVYTSLGSTPLGFPSILSRANGVAVVDTASGRVVAVIPLGHGKVESTTLLGWAGDLPVLGLHTDDEFPSVNHIVTWDYRGGTLHAIAELPTPWVSWGVGL